MKEKIRIHEEQKNSAKKSPIKSGEVFDPEKELKVVRQVPKEEQREKLREFKEKLARQKEGLAEMRESITKLILANPEISLEKLQKYAENISSELGLSEKQKEITESMLKEYVDHHNFLKHLKEKYPNNDKELFKSLFRTEPKMLNGKVELIDSPVMLYFRLHGFQDYAYIKSKAFLDKRSPAEEEIKMAQNSSASDIAERFLISGLSRAVVVENAEGKKFDDETRKTFNHEEQHCVKRFFDNIVDKEFAVNEFKKSKTDSERKAAVRKYFLIEREGFEENAGDEILAYFKGEWTPTEILEALMGSGGFYDYYADYKEEIFDRFDEFIKEVDKKNLLTSNEIQEITEDIFVTKYGEIIKNGIDAFVELEKNGYSRDKAIAILMDEPLIKWPKVVKRLLEMKK